MKDSQFVCHGPGSISQSDRDTMTFAMTKDLMGQMSRDVMERAPLTGILTMLKGLVDANRLHRLSVMVNVLS